MPAVPKSTVEKPLTAIDYLVPLAHCNSLGEVRQYAERCPLEIRQDERFARAFRARMEQIKEEIIEELIARLPSGDICDPQQIADDFRSVQSRPRQVKRDN
jgi:hypothetical protein